MGAIRIFEMGAIDKRVIDLEAQEVVAKAQTGGKKLDSKQQLALLESTKKTLRGGGDEGEIDGHPGVYEKHLQLMKKHAPTLEKEGFIRKMTDLEIAAVNENVRRDMAGAMGSFLSEMDLVSKDNQARTAQANYTGFPNSSKKGEPQYVVPKKEDQLKEITSEHAKKLYLKSASLSTPEGSPSQPVETPQQVAEASRMHRA